MGIEMAGNFEHFLFASAYFLQITVFSHISND